MVYRAEQRQRVAVGAHPIEIGIAPADRHRRLGQTRHLTLPAKRRGDRADRPHPPVGAVRTHAGLLDIDDVRADLLQDVVAEPEALQDARREPLGDDIADADHVLGDLQPLGMADVEGDAALSGILVVELATHVRVAHTGEGSRRRVARGAPTNRRHRCKPRVGVVLPLDLETFRPHRRKKAGAARRGQKPRKVENPDPLQRKRLLMHRRVARGLDPARLGRDARRAHLLAEHRLGVLAQERRAAADLPARL